jgi:hypothetical protein
LIISKQEEYNNNPLAHAKKKLERLDVKDVFGPSLKTVEKLKMKQVAGSQVNTYNEVLDRVRRRTG